MKLQKSLVFLPRASDGGNLGWISAMSLSKDMLKVIKRLN